VLTQTCGEREGSKLSFVIGRIEAAMKESGRGNDGASDEGRLKVLRW
jgi:hypothetical protein